MKGFKNVSGMKTFYFRNKTALVVCGIWKKKKKAWRQLYKSEIMKALEM